MVRLKVIDEETTKKLLKHFNSTMVRLKVPDVTRRCIPSPISIPLWYD